MTQTSDVLASKRLAELQAMATAMGIRGISKMRKSDLIAAMGGPRPSGADSAPSETGRAEAEAPDRAFAGDRPAAEDGGTGDAAAAERGGEPREGRPDRRRPRRSGAPTGPRTTPRPGRS